jgi:hypothetical protein
MAKSGYPGGRQSLENTRVKGPIHQRPPESGNAKSKSPQENKPQGRPNRNVTKTLSKPEEVQ